MKILVSDDKLVSAIQQEFHEEYPFLKIEFFHANGNHTHLNKVTPGKTFRSLSSSTLTNTITILPSLTVSELEKKFQDCYGLDIQVFRKSGKAWLETTLTDNWTLQEQNEQGKALSA